MLKNGQITRVSFFYRSNSKQALVWEKKIKKWLKKKHPHIRVVSKNPQVLIVLGGDGTILEAARKFQKSNPIILGLNLGQVGFLASVREPRNFLKGLARFFNNQYWTARRMMLGASILRSGKEVFKTNALNEVAIQNLIGVVELEVGVEGDPIQKIRGTGVLISTATGSTAYNLSAHGPIIMPDMECFVVTEVLDHNIPSPSIVVRKDKKIHLKVVDFRERGVFTLAKTSEKADVVFIADGINIFVLEKGDIIHVNHSTKPLRFVELEKNYFFKSLQEKFEFR